MGRLGLAFRCFFRVLSGKPVPEGVQVEQPEALPALPAPAGMDDHDKTARAIQVLALLQKEGRLIDFLQEEIDGYEDAQVGAAVRSIHRDCRAVLDEYLDLRPVVDGEEDSPHEVAVGFDPSQIRLIGNVTGAPPFSGVLRHHGWRAVSVGLPEPARGVDPRVIAPAEVELK